MRSKKFTDLLDLSFQTDIIKKEKDKDIKKSLLNFKNNYIKGILSNYKENIIYFSIPFWWYQGENTKGEWFKYVPLEFLTNNVIDKIGYILLYYLISERIIDFSFSEFACFDLAETPYKMIIEFKDENNCKIDTKKVKNKKEMYICLPKKGELIQFKNNSINELKKKVKSKISNDLSNHYINEEHFDLVLNTIKKIKKNKDFTQEIEDILNKFKEIFKENVFNNIDKKAGDYGLSNLFKRALFHLKEKNNLDESIEDIKKRFLIFIYTNFLLFDNIGKIIFLPTKVFTLFEKGKKVDHSYGGIILALNESTNDDKIANENEFNNDLKRAWLLTNTKFRELSVWDWSEKAKRDILPYALHSAVAAIMARNMSHHQGSGVIPYLANIAGVSNSENIFKQYLKYIEGRMDFIASAATMEFPKSGLSLWFFKDLIVGFISQFGLINSICGSEGYDYNNINFQVYISDKKNLLDGSATTLEDLSKKDQKIWIPGGYTGMHAFYLIIENIMRNSAKYAPKSNNNKLTVKIKLEDIGECYIAKIWDNISTEVSKIRDFNERIRNSLIKKTGERREGDWGFAEMRICTTFLKKATEREAAGILEKSEDCPIECIESEDKTIGYSFKLKKPELLEIYCESNQ